MHYKGKIVWTVSFISVIVNLAVGQCDCIQKYQFRQFSTEFARVDLEDYWKDMYKSFYVPKDIKEKKITGRIKFVLEFDERGQLDLYFSNNLGSGAIDELKRVLTLTRGSLIPDISCVSTTGEIAIVHLNSKEEGKNFPKVDLFFAYVDPIIRYNDEGKNDD